MFDIGWQEIFVIGVVAIVVIGPKDLPRVLRAAGAWARKGRKVMREFHSIIDDIVDEADLGDLKEDAKRAAEHNFKDNIEKIIDPEGKLAHTFDLNDPDRDFDARIAKTIKDAPGKDTPVNNTPVNDAPAKGATASPSAPEDASPEKPFKAS